MPHHLALAWDKDHLIGVHAQVSRSHVGVLATFEVPFPAEIDFSRQPDEAATWLKTQLDRHHIRARQVFVALPRDEIVFRRLEVPRASDDHRQSSRRMPLGRETALGPAQRFIRACSA